MDKCDLCDERATHGVISIHGHKNFCKRHYHEYKMRTDCAPKPKQKKQPSRLEKEFKDAGIRVSTKNSGTQLVLAKKYTKVDFWPTTQRWYNRSTGESGIGKQGVLTNFGL